MNYAQKELDRTTLALQQARATVNTLKELLEGPHRPQQITLSTVAGSVTVPLPAFEGEDAGIAATFYSEVLGTAEMRVQRLEEEQLSWCSEALLLNKQEREADAARQAARQEQPIIEY